MTAVKQAGHRARVIDQFTRQAASYSNVCGGRHEDAIHRLLAATDVTASDIVLDVACGTGQVALAFAAVARHVTGIDVTPAMVERARALQQERSVENIRWFVGDGKSLAFADGAFSIVTCRYALHHMLDPAAVAAEMRRVCAPGGRVALVDVFATPEKAAAYDRWERRRDPSHVRALTLDELVGLAKANRLDRLTCEFYDYEIELEALLGASFPAPGDEATVRDLLIQDLRREAIGVGVHQRGTNLVVSYSIAMVVGRAPGGSDRSQRQAADFRDGAVRLSGHTSI
jgi:ubiquinone/menaquinone biosynthesis C-methylase UbiE